MRPALTAIALAALVLGIAGCGGGGGPAHESGADQPSGDGGDDTGGDGPAPDDGSTGSDDQGDDDTVSQPNDGDSTGPTPGLLRPALELPQLQVARADEIYERADTLTMTTTYGESNLPAFPTYTIPVRCSGSACAYTDPVTRERDTFPLEDMLTLAEDSDLTALGSKRGITLIQAREKGTFDGETIDATTWGAWMWHSGFAVDFQSWENSEFGGTYRRGVAIGDLTGSAPTGNAEWGGLMVASPTAAAGHGDQIFGTATLEYELAGTLDVTFSGLASLDGGAFHTAVIEFHDLQVDGKGVFSESGRKGGSAHSIHGGFFGPKHDEAAGTFESMNLLGAFGARRVYTVVIQSEGP